MSWGEWKWRKEEEEEEEEEDCCGGFNEMKEE